MEWRKSESNSRPETIERIVSGKVYVRANIKTVERTDEEGETRTVYEYEECLMTAEEYQMYSIEKQHALLDYVAMEMGVDIDE